MQQKAGVPDTISPGIGLLLYLVMRLDMVYQQEHLNRVWRRYVEPQPAAGATPPPPSGGFST